VPKNVSLITITGAAVTALLTATTKGTPASSSSLSTSQDAVQKIVDQKGVGYFLIIYTHTNDTGHAWMGIAHIEDKAGNILLKESDYKGWVPNNWILSGINDPGKIIDHKDVRYEMARFYRITEKEYKYLKTEMNSFNFDGKGYDPTNRNCAHWVHEILKNRPYSAPNGKPEENLDLNKIFPNNPNIDVKQGGIEDYAFDKQWTPRVLQKQLYDSFKNIDKRQGEWGDAPDSVKAQLDKN